MRPFRRVIAIGFDGMDPRVVEAMNVAGTGSELPHLARLGAQGSYHRLASTWPAQTPVAWSSFATGLNPGGHGIYDFLRRSDATYEPELGLVSVSHRSRLLPPEISNRRQGTPFWDYLADAGVASTILRCPCTWPPPEAKPGVRLLSGMGVPDIRGGIGTATILSTDPNEKLHEAEQLARLESRGRSFVCAMPGPRAGSSSAESLTAALAAEYNGDTVVVRSAPFYGGEVLARLTHGVWSDWIRLRFTRGPFRSARGIARMRLLSVEPHLRIYVTAVNFDPAYPQMPVSSPSTLSADLEAHPGVGRFGTAGMIEDHTGLSNDRFDYDAFLDHCDLVMAEREAMLHVELERLDHGFLFCLFDTPDRVQHMFWRFGRPGRTPGATPSFERSDLLHVIRKQMIECDAVIGRVLDRVDEETLVLVLSDHGFTSFRRAVHLNSWLRDQGFLAVHGDARDGPHSLKDVDWSRTRAYSLGFGGINLNLRGREPLGIVDAEELPTLSQRIAEAAAAMSDPASGEAMAVRACTGRQLYSGPCVNGAPDVLVGFARGYRASWDTALGGIPRLVTEENSRRWTGDHIVDPALVPGVLWSSAKVGNNESDPGLLDMAPTILSAFGVPVPAQMEGRSLW
ncbi:MAG: alkaline phosphatase family protein [Gemmatimonadota bacterium]